MVASESEAGKVPAVGSPVRGSRSGRPIMVLLDLLGRRWTLRVLWELRDGRAATFRELQARCDGVSASVLNDRLRELRDVRIVVAGADGYHLSGDGMELVAALAPLQGWVQRWSDEAGDEPS
ncbi:helix-turn-helix transcriptional regulator [Nocardia sp. NBC_00508]|uniref:winged helix-turn-helix transcriptional regulator n=1 Tax=Nocardia sp. NBC_00508 TaxID=2975992 RepID=UPI002E80D030|nr:helix-turn-helix domain-containing protein [Nocardia sp. NBC_00508]WUD67162.1 helix-turn-helix transcriptional regulator [Nocardia sp. NBC_00508]